jgi:hypothetical protein
VLEAQPRPNKGLVAPPENILIHFFGSRDFAWVASTNLFNFKENYERFYKPSQKTKYYQTAVQLAADPELAAADQKRFEEDEVLYKNSQVAKNAEKEAKRKAKKEAEKLKKEEEELKESSSKTSRKRKSESIPPVKKKEKTSVAKIINNQTLLTEEKKTSLESLLRLRVKLQKFINSTSKSEHDFVKVDAYMKEAEEFPVDYELFRESKIGKVLKFVSKLELPQDSFDIVNRAHILINKWRSILQDQVTEGSKDQITTFVDKVIQESLRDLSTVEISMTETQDKPKDIMDSEQTSKNDEDQFVSMDDSKETDVSGIVDFET